MRIELVRLHKSLGTTTIYVTHDQVEAMTLGDRVAVMRAGRIQQIATPRQLYQHPQIERMKDKASRLLAALFERYQANPLLLPDAAAERQ